MEILNSRVAQFETLPLFRYLSDESIDPQQRLAFAPMVAHFVMSFADLYSLVLREEPARDKHQELVNAHTREDGDHWRWFLADLPKMGHDPQLSYTDALRMVWGKATERQRMLTYAMCRIGFGAPSLTKLVLVHCIEATGKVTIKYVSKAGAKLAKQNNKPLVYFGKHHLDTESDHTMEEPGVHRAVEDIQLTAEQATELIAVVHTSFDHFSEFINEMFDNARGARVKV